MDEKAEREKDQPGPLREVGSAVAEPALPRNDPEGGGPSPEATAIAETRKTMNDYTNPQIPEQLIGPENAQAIVIQWLDHLGFDHDHLDETPDGYSWTQRFTDANGIVYFVGWYTKWNSLQIQVDLAVNEISQAAFLMMSANDRVAFLSSIVVATSNMAVECSIVPKHADNEDPDIDTPPQSITAITSILVDRPRYCSDFYAHFLRIQGSFKSMQSMITNMTLSRQWK